MQAPLRGRLWPAKLFAVPVPCPACRRPLNGFMSLQGPAYALYPCYCEAPDIWVLGLIREMSRRAAGKPPQPVRPAAPTAPPVFKPEAATEVFVRRRRRRIDVKKAQGDADD